MSIAGGLRARIARVYRRLGTATACTGSQRRWLLGILAVAFALRLAWVLYAARPARGFQDPAFYIIFASRIGDGHGYSAFDGGPTAYYPVGYPAALGGIFWLLRHTPLPDNLEDAAGIFNLVLGVATVGLTFDVARRLFDNRVGLVAAGVMALYPNLVFHTAVALTETLFVFLVMTALLVLVSGRWEGLGVRRLVVFGVLIGLAALVRPISLLFLPVLLGVALVTGPGWRPALRRVTVASVAAVAVITPWAVRNLVVMDSPVIISTNLGDNLCVSRHADATGGFQLDSPCFRGLEDLERPEFEVRHNDRNFDMAVDFVLEHPLDEVRLWFGRGYHTLRHDHDGLDASESYGVNRFLPRGGRDLLRVTANVYFFGVFLLALVALPAFVAGRDPRRWFFLIAMGAMAATPLIFFGDARFKVPVVPFLAVGSAVTLVRRAGRARLRPGVGAGRPRTAPVSPG